METAELTNCDPIIKVGDLWDNQKYNFYDKSDPKYAKIDDSQPAIPCGLVAKSFFNDTFSLVRIKEGGVEDPVNIKEDNIAWSSDIQYKFKNVDNIPAKRGASSWKDVQWLDMRDQHFIVWMRTAGLPNFRKLWGRIDGTLEAGRYELRVRNEYEVAPFHGQKSFVISTTNALGGKNYFLAVCYITVGTFCLLFSFVFCGAYMKKRNINSNQSN